MSIALVALVMTGTANQVKTLAFKKYSDAVKAANYAVTGEDNDIKAATDDYNTMILFKRRDLMAACVSDFTNELRVNGTLEEEKQAFVNDLQRKLDAAAPKVMTPSGRGFPRVEL